MTTGSPMIDLLGLLLIGFGSLFVIILGYLVYEEWRDYDRRDWWDKP